jgi:uncharacterized protein YraI
MDRKQTQRPRFNLRASSQSQSSEPVSLFAAEATKPDTGWGSRRDFLRLAMMSAASALLSACRGGGGPSDAAEAGGGGPVRTEVIVRTLTLEPSDTPLPSDTPTPTATATATKTPTPTVPVWIARVPMSGINLRAGPGTTHPVETLLSADDELTVIGRDPDGGWLKVRTSDGLTGWVAAGILDFDFSIEIVPIAENIPTAPPPPPPTNTPVPPTPVPPTAAPPTEEPPPPPPPQEQAPPPPPEEQPDEMTQPCGAPIPPGYVCTCDCVCVCQAV